MNLNILIGRTLKMSFDKLRTNGAFSIPFVLSPSIELRTGLSKHERSQINTSGNDGLVDYLR